MNKICLGDVAQERKESFKGSKDGFKIVGLEHITPQDINLSSWEEGKENTFTKMFYKGDVLFGRRRAYLKKAAIAPFDGICSGDITVIQAISEKLIPELLPFIIQNDSLFDFAVEKSAGSLSPRVKWEHLRKYEINLPSLAEQKKLAKVLWAAEKTRQGYKSLLTKTDDLIKSKFIEMFGGVKTSPLKNLANVSVGQSSPYDEEFSTNGTPFIKAGNLEDLKLGRITEKDCNLVDQHIVNQKKLKLKEAGTILVAKSGMSCLSGHVYSLKTSAYVVSHLACIAPKGDKALPEFLKHFFITYTTKSLIQDPSYPSIQVGQLENMNIPAPSLTEQNKFAEFVKQAEQSKAELQNSLDNLNAMTTALINENLK